LKTTVLTKKSLLRLFLASLFMKETRMRTKYLPETLLTMEGRSSPVRQGQLLWAAPEGTLLQIYEVPTRIESEEL